jgi:hypothetical protein
VALFESPLSWADVVVSAASSNTRFVKAELVDTCTWYEVAPVDADQLSASEVGWFRAPFAGAESTGAGGAAAIVVKLHAVEYALDPPALAAFTCQ